PLDPRHTRRTGRDQSAGGRATARRVAPTPTPPSPRIDGGFLMPRRHHDLTIRRIPTTAGMDTRRTVCPDRTRRHHLVPTPRRIDPRGQVALRRVPRDRRLPRPHARHRVTIRALRHLRRHIGSRTPGTHRRTRQQQEERPGRHHRPPRHHRRGRGGDRGRGSGGGGVTTLSAPFPYFGGKRRAAPTIWGALGDPGGYVEPFAGSAAVLPARPEFKGRRVETLNDADGWLVNTWRAIQLSPADVAAHASGPVTEIDYHARLAWLQERRTDGLVSWLEDRKSTRLNSSHVSISYAVF